MAGACSCGDLGLGNSGKPGCPTLAGVARLPILVPTRDADGNLNCIDMAADLVDGVLPDSFVQGKINEADPSKRWYPLCPIDNVEDVRGDSIFQTVNSGQNFKVQDGPRTFTGIMIGLSPEYLGQLRAAACTEASVFFVDINGNFIGNGAEITDGGMAGNFYPLKIDGGTWDPQYIKATDTEQVAVGLNFEFDRSECDEDLKQLAAAETETNMLTIQGLLDICSSYENVTTASFDINLFQIYGTAALSNPDLGVEIGDVALFNQTTVLAVAVGSWTDNGNGNYTVTFTAQTSADVMEVTITKTGRDYTKVKENTVTLP